MTCTGKEKDKVKYYLRGIGIGLLIAVILYSTVIIPQYKMSEEEIIERAKELGMVMEEEDDIDLSALTGTPSPTGEADLTPAEGADLTPEPTEEAEATPPASPDAPGMPDAPSGISGPAGTEPAAPSDGSGVTEPGGPSDGSGVTEPGGPSDGSGVTKPAGPSDGSGVTEPAGPSDGSGVTKPAGPSDGSGVTEPEGPPATEPVSQPTPTPTQASSSNDGKISITIVQGMNSEDFSLLAQQVGLVKDAKDFDDYLIANGYANDLRVGTYLISADATYEEIAKKVTPQ